MQNFGTVFKISELLALWDFFLQITFDTFPVFYFNYNSFSFLLIRSILISKYTAGKQ